MLNYAYEYSAQQKDQMLSELQTFLTQALKKIGQLSKINVERSSESVMDALLDLTILSKTNIMINSPSSFLKTALLLRKING